MDSHLARRWRSALILSTALALLPNLAEAGPREDMKAAYDKALGQANELEYDAALGTINGAISTAEAAGAGQDPVLASLYVLRAALTFSNEGSGAKDKIVGDLKRALTLNYYVVVPVELRSDDLTKYLDQARKGLGATAPQPITHTPPKLSCGEPLVIEALLGVPDGGLAALYWRKAGGGEFIAAEMPAFSNVAEAVISAADHGNGNIEYFIYAFDASNNPVANLGTKDAPLVFEQSCDAVADPVVGPTDPVEPDEKPKDEKPPKEPSSLPRVWINIGIGTGFGVASGTAENTYKQFRPGAQPYGAAEAGCAIARWAAGTGDVASLGAAELQNAFETFGDPDSVGAMMAAYDAGKCAERHPVSTGMALAPFHIEPEVSVRIGKRMSLGLFGRLQVITGAKMTREDPTKALAQSFAEDVRSPNPGGVKQKPAQKFTFGVGIKFKYFLGKDTKKFRPFVGAFAGYGSAALRVDMGFANDNNGNSVPDNQELLGQGNDGTGCFPVWPYNGSCVDDPDQNLAASVNATAEAANRVDVVRIGSGFVGALVGFNYQIVKHFAFFGELQIGAYFPSQTSVLFDLTIGPAITF